MTDSKLPKLSCEDAAYFTEKYLFPLLGDPVTPFAEEIQERLRSINDNFHAAQAVAKQELTLGNTRGRLRCIAQLAGELAGELALFEGENRRVLIELQRRDLFTAATLELFGSTRPHTVSGAKEQIDHFTAALTLLSDTALEATEKGSSEPITQKLTNPRKGFVQDCARLWLELTGEMPKPYTQRGSGTQKDDPFTVWLFDFGKCVGIDITIRERGRDSDPFTALRRYAEKVVLDMPSPPPIRHYSIKR